MAYANAIVRDAERWVRTEADYEAIAQGYYFDEAAGETVCEFFERFLVLTAAPFDGLPFKLMDWEVDFLHRAYGWMQPDGRRRHRECFIEIPKKNGKSPFCSGLALYHLFEEHGARVFCGAKTRGQAAEVFEQAAQMVEMSPLLRKHLRVNRAYPNSINYPRTMSSIKTLSADTGGADGKNASAVILDEVHQYPNRKLYDVVKYAGKARRQPMLIEITTAGVDRFSLCYELYTRAKQIIDGTVRDDLRFLPVVFEADPEKDDIDDPKTWMKANPAIPTILSIDDFRAEFEEAKRVPGQLNNFLRFSLNIWTEAVAMWLDVKLFNECAEAFGPEEFVGKRTFATIDLASVSDLAALTLTTDEDDRIRFKTFYFCPRDAAHMRSDHDDVPYRRWIDAGHLIATEGNTTDHRAIRAKLNELNDLGIDIEMVGIDPYNAGSLMNDLGDDGYDARPIPQRIGTLTAPSKEFQRRILTREIVHDGNPISSWCVANAAVRTDAAGNIMPDKSSNPKLKIDGVVTMVMGTGMTMTDAGPRDGSFTLL